MPADSHTTRLLLGGLLLWATAVRVWTALPNPTSTRFWDERPNVQNVEHVIQTGSLAPANGYHPTLSYLPHAVLLAGVQALHDRLGWPPSVYQGGMLNRLGYLLCRLIQVTFGVVSIWLVYRIGRRIFDPPIGLMAAFLFAAVPWHLRQSVIYKPDILLLMTGLLALLASLWALEHPSARRFALAGAAIGLCMASKFNAAPFAMPIVLGALWRGWREDRRFLACLVLAGAVAVAVLLLLDPWLILTPGLYFKNFSQTLRDYAKKGKGSGMAVWEMPVHAVTTLLLPTFHGLWLGVLALAGFTASLMPRFTRGWPAERRRDWAILASFAVVYVVAYSLITRNPSSHNWLMLIPITSLAAAWALVTAARWLALRRPVLGRLYPAAAVLFVAAASWPVHAWAYVATIPSTLAIAEEKLSTALPPPGRVVLTEAALRQSLAGPAEQHVRAKALMLGRPSVIRVERLTALPAESLSFADALVFPAARLTDPAAREAYGKFAAKGRVLAISAAPLRVRGADLVIVLQPAKLLSIERHTLKRPTGRLARAVTVAGLEPGQIASVHVMVPYRVSGLKVDNGGVEVPCVGAKVGRGFMCSTPRFRTAVTVRLRARVALRNGFYQVATWRPPAEPAPPP